MVVSQVISFQEAVITELGVQIANVSPLVEVASATVMQFRFMMKRLQFKRQNQGSELLECTIPFGIDLFSPLFCLVVILVLVDLGTGPPEPYHPLFAEEKLVFGIYASTLSTFTLSLIRKVYNQADAKAIARQVRRSGLIFRH